MGVSPRFSFLFGKKTPLFHFRDFWEEEGYLARFLNHQEYMAPFVVQLEASGFRSMGT